MTEETPRRLLALLGDGRAHSGSSLGASLGLSRAAVWKQMRTLRSLGVDIDVQRNAGYRLLSPQPLLSGSAILRDLDDATRMALESLEIVLTTKSTSEQLRAAPSPSPGGLRVLIAEHQSGGRGRRGRRWISPLGAGIWLSVSWRYDYAPRDLPALSLATGVAVSDALEAVGAAGIRLKWPNDLIAPPLAGRGEKLGGILVDVAGETAGPLQVVIGVGLNVLPTRTLADEVMADGGLAPAHLVNVVGAGKSLSRDHVAATLIGSLHRMLRDFGQSGFAPFVDRFRGRDHLFGKAVSLTAGNRTEDGIARGIDLDGSLLVESQGALKRVAAGDVSLRAPS